MLVTSFQVDHKTLFIEQIVEIGSLTQQSLDKRIKNRYLQSNSCPAHAQCDTLSVLAGDETTAAAS